MLLLLDSVHAGQPVNDFFIFSQEPLAEQSAAVRADGTLKVDDTLFAVGAAFGPGLQQKALKPENAGWEPCLAPPQALGDRPGIALLGKKIYVTGTGEDGRGVQVYDPIGHAWKVISPAPEDLRGFIGTSCGTSHLLFFNGNEPDDRILAYHQITDEWLEIGRLPVPVQAIGAVSAGNQFTVYSETEAIQGTARMLPTRYGLIDHLMVAILILAMIILGAVLSRRERSSSDYFRAGNRIPWWAAGLSLFATLASAVSLMSMPGKSYSENWIYFSISIFTVLIQLPLMLKVYIPLARRLRVSTANEYLERRFSLPVRLLGFVFYSLNQVLARVASILLLPALALNSIFGLPLEYSILIMGLSTTIFVTMGGLEAVIWTDVLQAVIMVCAVLFSVLWAFFSLDLSGSVAMGIVAEQDKLHMFDFGFNLAEPVVIIMVANLAAYALGIIGDQNFIQRVQCTHSEKESRRAVITQVAVAVPLNLILFSLGTLLFLYYKSRPESINPAMKPDQVFPFFAAQNLPPGLAGIVVAALLAATISTVSSALNSVANLGVEDVYRRFFRNASDRSCVLLGRGLTVGLGLFGTAVALLIGNMSQLESIWDLTFEIMGYVLSPITGIFVLGIFTKRANSFGIWVGTIVAVAFNMYFTNAAGAPAFFRNLNPLAYLAVGVFMTVSVGYAASYLAPRPRIDLAGLTAYTLMEKESED